MKTSMLFMALFFMGCTLTLSAQSSSDKVTDAAAISAAHPHEIGIRFFGLDGLKNFNLIYKKQLKSGNFFRVRLANLNFDYRNGERQNGSSLIGAQAFVGLEKRKAIKNNLYFIHGFQAGLSISYSAQSDINRFDFSPSIGYLLGLHYDLSSRFYVNLETIPSLYSNFNVIDGNLKKDFTLGGGFNSNSVNFTLAYRF